MMELACELREFLLASGADLVGFADMRGIEGCTYPVAVSVACCVPKHILQQLLDKPTREYYRMYHAWNAKLDEIVRAGAVFLQQRGYTAYANSTDHVCKNEEFITPIPHKTVATRAGLGWIGKSCLLVTPEYGSAVRISSLLTNAPLPCAEPITQSRCGNCRICVDACPAQALHGTLWSAGMPRSEILDWQKCRETQKKIMLEATGIDQDLCGKCFAVCPNTRRYAEREDS